MDEGQEATVVGVMVSVCRDGKHSTPEARDPQEAKKAPDCSGA